MINRRSILKLLGLAPVAAPIVAAMPATAGRGLAYPIETATFTELGPAIWTADVSLASTSTQSGMLPIGGSMDAYLRQQVNGLHVLEENRSDAAYALELDNDPDAHGGEWFDDVDELIAYLDK
jgi:hypothetical protein